MRERVDGLDERWLERAAALDPVTHAYAVWDLRHEPDRVRFVSCRDGSETVAYLLEWRGPLFPPVVHWVGAPDASPLFEAWPDRPFVAVVPRGVVEPVRRARGPIATYDVELRAMRGGSLPPDRPPVARRLTVADGPALRAFRDGESESLLKGYVEADLDRMPIYGSFEGERLVAVAKASVVLPGVWMLTGIVTARDRRGRGHGRAVTRAAAEAALAAGARPALYVRADNAPAVRIYGSLGFERVETKVWVDAGANRTP